MAIKAQIRMIAVATGITWPISVRIFLDGDVDIHLMPLLVLFDYIYPPEPAFYGQLLDHENALYIESLHDAWIVSASGLRAPPMS